MVSIAFQQSSAAAPNQPVASVSTKTSKTTSDDSVRLTSTDVKDREIMLYAESSRPLSNSETKKAAIKLARGVFASHKGATRFKVTIKEPRESNQVSISIGDVRAIEGKLVSEEQVMSSLEITPSNTMASANTATQIGTVATRTPKPASVANTHVSHMPASNVPSSWISHLETKSGIVFYTPNTFVAKASTDKNSLLKLHESEGMGGEIELQVCDPGITPDLASQIFEQAYLSNMQNFRKLKEERIAFGTTRKIDGILKDYTFTIPGMNVRQRLVLFKKGDRTYSFSFIAPQNTKAESDLPTFSLQFLSNVSLQQAPSAPASAASKSESHRSIQYRSESAGVQFYYPAGWITNQNDKDAVFSVKNEEAGKIATLSLFQGEWHPEWSIESGASAVEEKYFASQKNYRRTEQDSTSVGSASAIPAVHQVSGFDFGTHRTKQMIVYFRSGNKLSALSMWTVGWPDSEMRSAFQKVIHTLSIVGQSSN